MRCKYGMNWDKSRKIRTLIEILHIWLAAHELRCEQQHIMYIIFHICLLCMILWYNIIEGNRTHKGVVTTRTILKL